LLSNNVNKRYCIDIVVILNKQQLQYYVVLEVVKNTSNLSNTIFNQLNVTFNITTNNNLILLKDIVKFVININNKNNKLSLKKNTKLYCCCNIALVILNQINKKINIKIKTNCFNILTYLIKLNNLFLKYK